MTPIEGRAPIAEDLVIWVLPSGERRPGRVALCAPEPAPSPDGEDDNTWACWWSLDGMDGIGAKPRRSLGSGSLQPMILALEMIGYELHAFISRGGKVLSPDEPGSAGVLGMLRLLMRRPGAPPPADPVLAELDAEISRGDDDP